MISPPAEKSRQLWDAFASVYEDTFASNIPKLYQDVSGEILAQLQKASSEHPTTSGMDFAIGHGEPSRTFWSMLDSLQNSEKEKLGLTIWTAMDLSSEFLAKAKAAIKVPKTVKLDTILFTPGFDFETGLGPLDLIVCSLGLMYTEIEEGDQLRLLQQFSKALKEKKGALVAAVWPHPSRVPFLRILKIVGAHMGGGNLTLEALETTDDSFSLWNREKVQSILHHSGFELEKWEELDLPTYFSDFDSLIQSCRKTKWYNNPMTKGEAIQKVKELVAQELRQEVQDGPFTLKNKFVLFVARPCA